MPGLMDKEDNGNIIPAFVSDPAKSQAPFPLAAGTPKVFKVNPSSAELTAGVINITGWLAILIAPSGNPLTRYFNADATKTRTVYGGQENIVVLHQGVTAITLNGTDPSVEVAGM